MAGNSDDVFEIELSCPVCMELYAGDHVPKTLPECDHIVCAKCLKTMARKRRILLCPECQKLIRLPQTCDCSKCQQGVTSLKCKVNALRTNRKIRNLAEEHQKNAHKGLDVCKDHKHRMPFVCISCDSEFICQICLVRDHYGHDIEEIETVYAKQNKRIKSIMAKTRYEICQSKKTLDALKDLRQEVKSAEEAEKETINQFAEECIAEIKDKAQSMTSDLENMFLKKEERIDGMIDLFETVSVTVDSGYARINETVSNYTISKFVAHYEELQNMASVLSVLSESLKDLPGIHENGTSAAIYRKNNDFKCDINLGKLISQDEISTSIIHTVDVNGVTPLAWTSDGMLVLPDRASDSLRQRVGLYSWEDDRYSKSWFHTGKKWDPRGVAVSDGHIFISNSGNIIKYSTQGILSSKEFKVPPIANSACCVAITSNNEHVIVGNCNDSSLDIYDANGSVVRKIKTSISPIHITLIIDDLKELGQPMPSRHGRACFKIVEDTKVAISDYFAGKVLIMDFTSGEEIYTIDIPFVRDICFEEHTNTLLVVDEGGRAIHQYCWQTGKILSCVVSGLVDAHYLALFNEINLAVATKKHGVKIYEVFYKS